MENIKQEDIEQKLYSSKDAAKYLGISESRLRKYRLTGIGPIFTKRGTSISYKKTALDNWIDALPEYQSTAEYKEELLAGAK